MHWWGRLIGGIFGYLLTGSPLGAVFGYFVGNLFDRGIRSNWRIPLWSQQGFKSSAIQQIFFKVTFLVMGHVAKSDGRVSEDEIRVARVIMQRMQLSEAQKLAAIRYFNQGKQADFKLQAILNELMAACHHNQLLLKMFIDIQYQAAMANGSIGSAKRHILENVYQRLGFSVHSQQQRRSYSSSQRQYQRSSYQSPASSLGDAYATLEISSQANNHEVKRAYRKLMSQNHPDKLIAQGLPEEMVRLATDKTQKIRAAYEQIRAARGFK